MLLGPHEIQLFKEAGFRVPGGTSALRTGKKEFPCPTCGRDDMLTKADVEHNYQCDSCAEKEGCF